MEQPSFLHTEKNPGEKSEYTQEIASLEAKINATEEESKELFSAYRNIRRNDILFVLDLAHDHNSDDLDRHLVLKNKELLTDYIVNGTVAHSKHLDSMYQDPESIEKIDTLYKKSIDDTQGSDIPFNTHSYRELHIKVSEIKNILAQLNNEVTIKRFEQKKNETLSRTIDTITTYKNIHARLVQEKDTIEKMTLEIIQPYLDMGMTREAAINVYQKQSHEVYLREHELYDLNEGIAMIEELLLSLEIHKEHLEDTQYENYSSFASLDDITLRGQLNNSSFLTSLDQLLKKYPLA